MFDPYEERVLKIKKQNFFFEKFMIFHLNCYISKTTEAMELKFTRLRERAMPRLRQFRACSCLNCQSYTNVYVWHKKIVQIGNFVNILSCISKSTMQTFIKFAPLITPQNLLQNNVKNCIAWADRFSMVIVSGS